MGLLKRIVALAAKKTVDGPEKVMEKPDERKPMPQELANHFSDCVRVSLTREGWELMQQQTQGRMTIRVRKARKREEGAEYAVSLPDGTCMGHLSENDFLRSGAKTRGEMEAEVYGPIWQGESSGRMYLPMTEEALRRRDMKVYVNIDGTRWTGPDVVDGERGEILARSGKGKPTYVITAGGSRLCEVTPRMKCYAQIAERADMGIRLAFAERRESEHGPYWRLQLYF